MTTQYTSILKLALPVQGELSGTWGDVVNDNITSMVEEAVAGRAVVNTWTTNSHVLTTADGTTSESRCAMLEFTDTGTALTGAATVVCPSASKLYVCKNDSGQQVTVNTAAGTGVAIPDGQTMFVFCDGTNVEQCTTNFNSLSFNDYTLNFGGAVTTAGAFTTSGAYALTLTTTGATNVTLPTTGTLATLDGTETLTNKTLTSPTVSSPTLTGTISATDLTISGNTTIGDDPSDTLTVNSTITSNLIFTDDTYDIGAVGATRPRNLYLSGNATIGGTVTLSGGIDVTGALGVDGDFDVNTDKFTVTSATGNTAVAGTLSVTGITTATGGLNVDTINEITAAGGVTIDSVLLKDDGVNATNIEITNLKANDGTAAGSIADITGAVTINSFISNSVDIGGGSIDGAAVGASSASTGAFTTLTASTSLNIAASTTVDGVLDEDTLVSDSATKLATQQSIKAYVDGQSYVTDGDKGDVVVSSSGAVWTVESAAGDFDVVGDLTVDGQFVTIENAAPILALNETGVDSDYSGTWFLLDGANMRIQTRTNAGAQVSNDYQLTKNASGATAHIWSIADSEAAMIDSSGNFLVGKSSNAIATAGAEVKQTGAVYCTVDNDECLEINRLSTDGILVRFWQDTSVEGNISVSGSTVSYNGGHLARWTHVDSDNGSLLKGTVMTNLDEMCVWKQAVFTTQQLVTPAVEAIDAVDEIPEERDDEGNIIQEYVPAVEAREAQDAVYKDVEQKQTYSGSADDGDVIDFEFEGQTYSATVVFEDNEQLNKNAVSSVEGDPNVSGVFVNYDEDGDINLAMTGDMVIRIAQGTTVARGDLLMSAGDGTAKPQGDDIVRSKTIAKVTSTNITKTYDDGSYLVPCVLMAC